MKHFKYVFLIYISLFFVNCNVIKLEPVELLTFTQKLEKLFPGVVITKMETTNHFTKEYQLVINQPYDHTKPELGFFKQYIYLSHINDESPTVLVTEGYKANPKTYEVTKILKANQVQVEYRFYGNSKPHVIPWNYLNSEQANEDYHTIVTKLKTIYSNKWISTGISKGGEAALIYKSKYPYDVNVVVPYVAPIIRSQEDVRTANHINSVGTAACRKNITNFQRLVLQNRETILKEVNSFVQGKNIQFTQIPIEEALEYAVLEFPFSFWQWGGKCNKIPRNQASPTELFKYLNSIIGLDFYSDKTYYEFLPSYYQHITELGYYGFDTTKLKDLLTIAVNPTNKRFAPQNADLTYNSEYMTQVEDFLVNQGHKILYIYGGYDTWFACAPKIKPHVNALKMVLEKGSHKTRIKDFSVDDRQLIYSKLQNWLGYSVAIYPLDE